jgi:hypothetical protein
MKERTAQRYMRLFSSGMKSDTVADLGIRRAYESLSTPKGEAKLTGAEKTGVDSLELFTDMRRTN